MTPSILARICARHHLARRDVLVVIVFNYGHPEQSFSLALKRYIAGEGPAAVAAGRAVATAQTIQTIQTIREVA